MVPYKRVELVVEAFRRMPDRRLVVTGDGPSEALVRAAAAGAPNIEFRGRVPQAELVALTQIGTRGAGCGGGGFRHRHGGGPGLRHAADRLRSRRRPGHRADRVDADRHPLRATERRGHHRRGRAVRGAWRIDPAACRANALRFSEAAFRERMRTHVEALLP